MITGELIDEAVELAKHCGFHLRFDHMGGDGTGHFQLRGGQWLVVDTAQPADEQLDRIVDAIATVPEDQAGAMSSELRTLLEARRTA